MQGGACFSDGRNIIDFGPIDKWALAIVCRDIVPIVGEIGEADMRFEDQEFWGWTVNPGPNCVDKADLEAIATHEWGHIFGMDDLPEDGNRNLTWSAQYNNWCGTVERTLGRGDWLGFDAKY